MTTETQIDMSDFDVSEDTFKRAGLNPEGWYVFEIKKVVPKKIEGTSQRTGEDYSFSVINVTLRAAARAQYNDQGEYQETGELPFPFTAWTDFGAKGGGLIRVKNAYRAVTGSGPSGQTNALGLGEELIGQRLWGRIYHSENSETGDIREKVASQFRSIDFGPPATVTVRS